MARTYDLDGRHPGTQAIMRWFATAHLSDGEFKEIVEDVEDLALVMLGRLPDDPELIEGLRKLVEAKDCFVRAAVAKRDGHG